MHDIRPVTSHHFLSSTTAVLQISLPSRLSACLLMEGGSRVQFSRCLLSVSPSSSTLTASRFILCPQRTFCRLVTGRVLPQSGSRENSLTTTQVSQDQILQQAMEGKPSSLPAPSASRTCLPCPHRVHARPLPLPLNSMLLWRMFLTCITRRQCPSSPRLIFNNSFLTLPARQLPLLR